METHLQIVRERAQEACAQTLDAIVRIQVGGFTRSAASSNTGGSAPPASKEVPG
jgi:hypothetical protein